jgi:hypothetical protein
MKRSIVLISAFLLVIGFAGAVGATSYEYYEGFQAVYESDTYDFYFDLVLENEGDTEADMEFHDVALGWDSVPLANAYVNIGLWSEDLAAENVEILLTAYYDDAEYVLYDGWFNGYELSNPSTGAVILDQTDALFTFDISDTSFVNDPYGEISIVASITGMMNYNDFAITEVGVGTAPVPEPATMLLLGTGLVGLAVSSRKKFFKK